MNSNNKCLGINLCRIKDNGCNNRKIKEDSNKDSLIKENIQINSKLDNNNNNNKESNFKISLL